MKNQDYWRQRFEQLENAQNQMGLDALAEITQQYNKAIRNIDKQIRDWYSRFADNNGLINMAEARKFLKGKELKEFKWDLKEYADKARQSAFSDTWEKELLNISAKVHVSRLEALKTQLRQQVEMLFAEQADVMQKSLGESYKSDYYHSAYEIQKGFNVGWDMPSIDQNAINTVLSKPWAPDGYNFSERIWNNKEKLLSELNTVMTQNIMTGAGPQKAIDTLAKKMNTSRSNAGRLVMTESAYFSSLGRQQCFKDLDVEKYEIVATLDGRTSETCRHLDGKVFDMKDFKAGVTAPPFHVRCRTTTAPYFADDYHIGQRVGRDEEGKRYYVPGDMKYEDWKAVYIDGKLTIAEYEKSLENGIIKTTTDDKFGFKSIIGAHSRQDDLKAVNPNYNTGKREWTHNCQRCVSAYEARIRGYDVEALPRILDASDRLPNMLDKEEGWTSVYDNPKLIQCASSSGEKTGIKVKKQMSIFGDGARAIVRVQWQSRYGQGGHVFVAEQKDGKTLFVDPQSGREDVERYFKLAKKNATYLLRIDNLEFTDNIKKCCKNREVD